MKLLSSVCFLGREVVKDVRHSSRWSPRHIWQVGQHRYCSTDMAGIRSVLQQFDGGSVDLVKNASSGIARIILNHPEKKNALSGKMMCDLMDIVNDLEQWDVGKGVLMHGTDGTFCSGGDLDLVRAVHRPQLGTQMSTHMCQVAARLHRLPLISVAMIQGRALGGGAELATFCDFRLVTETVSIGFVHGKMGIVTGFGGGYRLGEIVGHVNALELLSTSQIFSCKGALDLQFASAILPDGSKAIDMAEDWLSDRISAPAETVHAIKKMVLNGKNPDMAAALEKETEIFASVWGAPVHQEALAKNMKHK